MSKKSASLPAAERIPLDVLFVLSDLLTGKSVPVLVGIARLPVDQFLVGVVLSMGALAGALFSVYACVSTDRGHRLARWNRVLQACYGLVLSLSLALSLARGIHYQRGIILSLAPAFCLVAQTLSQRESAALLGLLLFVPALAIGLSSPVPSGGGQQAAVLPSVLRGLNPSSPLEEEAVGVWEVLGRALQLFVLAFYASVQHALPADSDNAGVFQPSRAFLALPVYALFVSLVGALVRVVVWYLVCYVQDNALHLMLENDISCGAWAWPACVAYTVVLLYASVAAASQIRDQLLRLEAPAGRLKFVACALALAALYRQRDPAILFVATGALAGVSVAVAALTLESVPW